MTRFVAGSIIVIIAQSLDLYTWILFSPHEQNPFVIGMLSNLPHLLIVIKIILLPFLVIFVWGLNKKLWWVPLFAIVVGFYGAYTNVR